MNQGNDYESRDAILHAEDELADAYARQFPHSIPVEPCDSPIEDQFLWELKKVKNPNVSVARQVEISTEIGTFRPDFVIECSKTGRKVAIECDGKNFHNADRDSFRDTAIVRANAVDRIYRLRGKDICWHIAELLDMLGLCEPWIISERGRRNLESRTLPAALREEDLEAFSLFFTASARRDYTLPEDSEDDEDIYPHRPIVIEWTSRMGRVTNPGPAS